MPKIETQHLNKLFVNKKKHEAVAALYDVNCTIPNNSFCVIVGKSGCGKTTLLRVLAGLIPADSGVVTFDGKDVSAVPAQKRNVAYLSQEYALYPHLTVFDNIAYPLKIMRAAPDEIRRRVAEVCQMLEIAPLTSRRIRQLSGGQLQRVALARALVKNPDVVFLDEPLSNLDEKTRLNLSQVFAVLQKKLNGTFVYVTHNVAEAQRLATHVLVMDNGTVVQQGPSTTVLKEGVFREFAEASPSPNELAQIVNDDDEIV